jgi:hypothetical protein
MGKNSYSRISENVLFTLLVATVIGWMALSVTSNPLPASAPATVMVAASGSGNS